MSARLLPLITSGLFRGLGAVSQFLLAWWVSKTLAKDESGAFFLYLACHTVLSPILLMGTQYFGLRQISQFDESDTESIRRQAYRAGLLSLQALMFALIALLIFTFTANSALADASWFDEWADMLLPLTIGSAITGISLAVASHLHGLKKFGFSLFYSHISIPLFSIFLIAMVGPDDSTEVVYCHVVACLLATIAAIGTWAWCFRMPTGSAKLEVNQAVWAESWDLWLISCCILVVSWSPIIVGGFLVEPGQVAELNIGQRAANLINFVLIIISFTYAPRLRRAWAKSDILALRQDIVRCSQMLLSIGTVAFVLVFLTTEWLLSIFGKDYTTGATVLRIFAAAQYFNVVTGSVNQILMMWGYEKTLRSICFASAGACLVLTLALGVPYGSVGIASGAGIALSLHNVLAVLAVKRHLGFWVFDLRRPQMEACVTAS